jgi:hypothetical protein
VVAYRFLCDGARDILAGGKWTGDGWFAPSAGVVAHGEADLPHWIAPELWVVEVDGAVVPREHSFVAERGRLVERVSGWDATAAVDFLNWCIARHPSVSCTPSDTRWNAACDAGYDAAQTAGMAAEEASGDFWEAVRTERAAQLEWIRRRIGASG